MVNEELKTKERLALATLKANKEIQLKKIRASTLSRNKQISQLKNFQIGQQLNAEQGFLHELFGGGQKVMFNNPNSESLPQLNGSLMPNRINNDSDETAESFGFGINKFRSGLF